MPAAGTLDRGAVAALDSTGMLDDVLGFSEHLRDGIWRVESSGARPVDAPGGVVVAGAGGSAVGGRLARAALGDRLTRPFLVVAEPRLPSWIGDDVLVLCSSYSGETEETLALYDEAGARGAARIVSTTGGSLAARARRDGVPVIPVAGGFQPRAAVGYAFVAALEAAAFAGAAPFIREEIEAASDLTAALAAEWGPDAPEDSEAKALARALHDRIPIAVGGGLAGAAAYRFKCQVNENVKLPSWAVELPEGGHNEIVGWDMAGELGRFALVAFDDPLAPERDRRRDGLVAGLARTGMDPVVHVRARGERPVERLASFVLLGDLVSLYLAILRGVDPDPIPAIGRLKAGMAQ